MQQNQQQVQIKADDKTLQGHYANALMASHTPDEFVLDFIFTQQPAPTLVSRIIVTPAHFKRMLAAMQENLTHYEKAHGTIHVEPGDENKNAFGFQI